MTKHTYTSARALIMQAYNGAANLMTPDVRSYGWKNGHAYELSHGEFMDHDLFGVTVVREDGEKMHDLCTSFSTQGAALDYIRAGFRKPAEKA